MTGDISVETPVIETKELEKTDKEVIALEEKEAEEMVDEKKDEGTEKTDEIKEETTEEKVKKVNMLQKIFGKRKDLISPKVDEVVKTDKEAIEEEEKVEEEKKEDKEDKEDKVDKVQRFKKLFSMKKNKKESTEETEKAATTEEDIKEEGAEKEDEEKKDEEKIEETEAVAEAEVSVTTAEKKTLMQKLMTIKRDLMASRKEEPKVEEEKKEGEEEVKKDDEAEVKEEGTEEVKEEVEKDELGEEKPKPSARIKKFFSIKRQRRTTETEEKKEDGEDKVEKVEEEGEEKKEEGAEVEGEKKDEEVETDGAEKVEKAEKVNLLKRLFGRKPKVEEKKDETIEEVKEEEVEGEANKDEVVVEVEVKEAEPEILRLHLVGRTPMIPSIVPMQLKLESWLMLHDVKYENTPEKDNLPATAYQPLTSNKFIEELSAKHGKEMPMELTAEQKGVQHAMVGMVEKNLHFSILSWQCTNVDNIIKGYKINLQEYLKSKAPMTFLRLFFKNNFCKSNLKLVKSNGFAQHTVEQMEKLATEDLKVLAEMLGDKDFFFGASPSLLDLVVFSHLAQLTTVDEAVVCPLREAVAEHSALSTHVVRMQERCWGEHWNTATAQLELNPHIPKPVTETVEDIVAEVVEAATEETAEEKKTEDKEEDVEKKVEEKVEEVELV